MISQVVALVNAQLAAIGAWCQTVEIGDAFVEETGAPPRIVLVPSDESFSAPTNPGGNPRNLYDRHVRCELVIWGSTRDNTEGMIDQFVIALHRAIKAAGAAARGGSYKLGAGKWQRKTNLSVLGYQYRAQVELIVPVWDRDWSTTPAQPPEAATYTGDQTLTNPRIPNDTQAVADVAEILGASQTPQGNVTVTVPKP